MNRLFLVFLTLLVLAPASLAQKQTTITVKNADSFKPGVVNGRRVQKLIGNVQMVQENTNIYCDSAYLYTDINSATAFGHVRILDRVDSLDMSGEYLEYKGNTRVVEVRRNVILKDDSTTLYTNNLDYDRKTSIGYYFDGGKLVDSLNVLTSFRGYYNSQTKEAQFLDSVILDSPDMYLETDTLDYHTETENSRTRGRTWAVTADADTLSSNVGMLYQPRKKISEVYYGTIVTKAYEIVGDTLIANDSLKYYLGIQNVSLESFEDSLTIYAHRVRYDEPISRAKAYNQAYLRKMMNGDSLFIKADTLLSVQNEEDSVKYLSAYFNGQMYKSDMQANSDSIVYNLSDSTIYMYQDPVIWNVDSQISADSIRITTANNRIHRMYLVQNSFVISQDSARNFNQVKGRNMDVFFEEGFIRRTDVYGNGESIYFAGDAGGGPSSMNKLKCSNMRIYFSNNVVTELRTYREIDGRLIPAQEIQEPERLLRGFNWRISEKPTLRSMVRRQRYDR